MSRYKNAYPAEYFDDEDPDDYVQPQVEFNLTGFQGIKIIPKLGVEAGINKSHFDISLDENAQKWFDQIFQYWKQCE